MPIIKSAVKKMKQDQRRRARNLRTKRAMRVAVKEFENQPTFDNLRAAQSKIDTAVKKNVLTKPAAARRMSHLSAAAKKAGVKIVAVKKTGVKSDSGVKSSARKSVVKTAAPKVAPKTTAKTAVKKAAVKKTAAKK